MTHQQQSALLINISGIGDIISSLIVANAMAHEYTISYLIPKKFKGLLTNTNYQEITTDALPDTKFDVVIDLTSNADSRKLIQQLHGTRKIGRIKNWIQRFKFCRIYHQMVPKYPESDHIVWDYLPILQRLGYQAATQLSFPRTDIALQPQIAIHIGADKEIRRIPESLVIELCRYFSEKQYRIRLLGTESDIAQRIQQQAGDSVCYEQGDLSQVRTWLSQSALVIAPDSGLFHLASAMGIPTIGLYGPNTYARAGAINTNATELSLSYDCRPCNQNKPCPYQNRCMKDITLEMVLEKVQL